MRPTLTRGCRSFAAAWWHHRCDSRSPCVRARSRVRTTLTFERVWLRSELGTRCPTSTNQSTLDWAPCVGWRRSAVSRLALSASHDITQAQGPVLPSQRHSASSCFYNTGGAQCQHLPQRSAAERRAVSDHPVDQRRNVRSSAALWWQRQRNGRSLSAADRLLLRTGGVGAIADHYELLIIRCCLVAATVRW